jgi:UDP-glucose 4-epimerase
LETEALTLWALGRGIKKFIFASSAAVYGNANGPAQIEESVNPVPINPYGASKLRAELALNKLAEAGFMSVLNLRFFNIVGQEFDYDFKRPQVNLFPIIVNALIKEIPLPIFETNHQTLDNSCIRDYVGVQDVINAIKKSMTYLESQNLPVKQTVNIGSGIGISVKEVADLFQKEVNQKIKMVSRSPRQGEPAIVLSSIRQARNLIDWSPSSNIEEVIASTVRSARKHFKL